jgi:heme-degrading monooxygenase HmoA
MLSGQSSGREGPVFARVSIYEIPDGRSHEAATSFGEAMGTIASHRGLVDAYFLVARESDRAIVVTLWESEVAMTASRVTATRLRSEAARAVDAEILSVEEFEVAARESGVVSANES